MNDKTNTNQINQRGSILLYILLGIVLLGALTVVLRNTSSGGQQNIDAEDLILKAGQVQKYGDELSASVHSLLSDGISEADIRFAHPDAPTEYGTITLTPQNQVFGKTGGKATYRTPPSDVNDGSLWEFFATTNIPQVGSDKADLVAVLPHVTQAFCQTINKQLGFSAASQPTDNVNGATPDCVMGASTDRFTGVFEDSAPNTMDSTTFSRLPALQACVYCASDSSYNYYYVLLPR